MTLILGIETSCDETAAAVVADGRHVRSNLIASQYDLHAKYGGVVPELAARAHIERLDPLIREALIQAAATPADLDAIAVTARPGLIGALLIGVAAAKTLAWSWRKPLLEINHIHAHATSAALEGAPHSAWSSPAVAGIPHSAFDDNSQSPAPSPSEGEGRGEGSASSPHSAFRIPHSAFDSSPWPAIALVVSGGHTALFLVRDPCNIESLGSTLDDAAGEAFDKVAMILGLGYPGGPVVDRRARNGRGDRIAFPRTLPGDALDFSFSGLKTAVLYHVHGPGRTTGGLERLSASAIDDICASFSAAVIDVLVARTLLAVERAGVRTVVVGGGVAANTLLRERLAAACAPRSVALHLTPPEYCTDNAAMIAAQGYHQLLAGRTADLSMPVHAS